MKIGTFISAMLLWGLCLGMARAEVVVFAAASMRGALDEIARNYDSPVTLSYGGSGSIARQIAQGAPADLVILAHPRWMQWLTQQNITDISPPTVIAGNRLVVIGPQDALPLNDLMQFPARLGTERLAMGQRASVPAGIYAQQSLVHLGLWPALQNQLAEVENVRLALSLVLRSETGLGVVYHSDAMAEPGVKILAHLPESSHETIRYPGAALSPQGQRFLDFLLQPKARSILKTYGFLLP